MEEDKNKPKVLAKIESDDFLAERILHLLERQSVREGDLRHILGLSYVTSLRLKEIVRDLVASGRVALKEQNGARVLERSKPAQVL